jgi:8-oxo-dGTP pyrophosphatase MutT (NUDIX family)
VDADWGRDDAYLEGLDLLVAGYPWEAHERLEAVWRAWPDGPLRRHAQALIHAAACDVHLRLARPRPAAGQAAKAAALWNADVARGPAWFGLCDRNAWLAAVESVAQGASFVVWPSVPAPMRVVGGAAFRAGRLLAMRRAPHRADGGFWEFPGGKVEAGEAEPAALSRELAEELGWEARPRGPVSATGVDRAHGGMRLSLWHLKAPEATPALRDHDAVCWLARDEVQALAWVPADIPLAQRVVGAWDALAAT